MQTLRTAHFNHIILQTPLTPEFIFKETRLGFEGYYIVYILEELRDCVCAGWGGGGGSWEEG